MLKRNKNIYYFSNKKLFIDLIVLVLFILFTATALIYLDAAERIYSFTRQHEELELDELILLLAISSIYMFLFILKRFMDLKELILKACTDPLLGLINRASGLEYIINEIKILKSSTSKSSLIMYDIDHFKKVNDTYGHDVGDYILKAVTNIVIRESRSSDISVRWGGEEFIVICPNTNLKNAVLLAERFRASIENYVFENHIKVTASFGVIELNKHEQSQEQLIKVDEYVYQSKANGRNQVTH
ncbi:GGDEF domain-containing protein [Colwellia sp. TT2012]|uniref:GGDEF domain-containing protein n=1 Tax=Colwellia sp. TT2012 TaxID=1720342 RepID=UPI00070F8ED1|nr:GGDEF domain-containing protein [Colwellia sp. TT2012]